MCPDFPLTVVESVFTHLGLTTHYQLSIPFERFTTAFQSYLYYFGKEIFK